MSARAFTADEARDYVHAPHSGSDKYSRGVVGFVTGSVNYPGAALLGVDGALHAGIGMVRYVGPEAVGAAVLQHRPEVVLGDSRAGAWVVGSGVTTVDGAQLVAAARILDEALPAVVDAGALNLLSRHARGLVIATPHAGELAQLLGVSRTAVEAEPEEFATLAARFLGVTVVLKGATTYVAGAGGSVRLDAPTSWLAIAGAGDVLAGIMGQSLPRSAPTARYMRLTWSPLPRPRCGFTPRRRIARHRVARLCWPNWSPRSHRLSPGLLRPNPTSRRAVRAGIRPQCRGRSGTRRDRRVTT